MQRNGQQKRDKRNGQKREGGERPTLGFGKKLLPFGTGFGQKKSLVHLASCMEIGGAFPRGAEEK
jgi:hypothetical protein